MSKKPKQASAPPNWFLPQWRKFRGLSGEKLSELSGFGSKGYVSILERGKRRYNGVMLKKFAEALNCEPWEIISVNPLKRDEPLPPNVDRIVEEVKRVPEDGREEFIDSVKAALDRISKKKKVVKEPVKKKV